MVNLVRHIFTVLFFVAAGYNAFAQAPTQLVPSQRTAPANARLKKGTGAKLEAARNNYISRQLDLSDEQGTKFWPLYRHYQQELTAVRILKRLNNSKAASNGTEQIDREIYYESQLVAIRKRYRDAFAKILQPEKVSMLYKSEQEFNDELIKRLSESGERAGN
ncbi:hypothetical protein [Mucilaginibacter sp. FT3.2]|uniref:hypothetical protein n=1 Tax=Mucilaginibacter sp. FT3.2 TaxID=2723090 RepID=UPI001612CCC4|nr:hypothetical protein [Mucilaginibacter sp. FT3.2]MBB6230113.1 hypothetical protein [Mucilaginibacter sp. FT3.2]